MSSISQNFFSQELRGLLDKVGAQVLEEIRTNLRDKKVTGFGAVENTGQLSDSLSYRVSGTSIVVFVKGKPTDYWFTVAVGRRPGAFPPISAIRLWVEQRRIGKPEDYPSTAFLIARKIAREGTEIYQQYGKQNKVSGIYADAANPQKVNEIVSQVAPRIREIVQNEIALNYRLGT